MPENTRSNEVRQLRVVVEAADYEAAVALYRDVLGLRSEAAYAGEGDARVVILDAGRATLELANPAQRAMIDRVEVGRPASPHIRLAFQVDDAATATDALVGAGAALVAPPTKTPWDSLNSRLETPGDLQITLFQELGAEAATPTDVPFALVDVFGDAPLTGNPLAVVDLTDWDRPVDEAWYPTVARELNQSETTFILPGRDGAVRELRSFTAGGVEVFGAGHNALGAWWWLLETGRLGRTEPGTEIVQRIGGRNLPVVVRDDGRLDMRQTAARFGAYADPALVARAVGLDPDDISEELPPQVVDTGANHLMVLLRSGDALAVATPDRPALIAVARTVAAQGVYLAWLDGAQPQPTVHTRFFNPGVGLDEDPATGSAAGPLAALLHRHELLATDQRLTIVQGEKMGRRSTITAGVDPDGVAAVSGRGFITVRGSIHPPSPVAPARRS
ncbi:PhzF family phenazine biosynthesis isomerase [Micromonospora sp. NBC_01699]|uniref:PhzF family phenazine biosynthesis isomerase n=1 Tax=Micromonospora sp. NBC_01699 TaxID=2975984 RepID=UPI002E31ED77|nr:PhzF family phenazine biosynthesis isomerase [Micromonospora sp. NBC_01699]